MRWRLLALSFSLIAIAMLAFASPSSPVAVGLFSLGALLLIDWSWEQVLRHAVWGMETRTDEIVADFCDLDNARWRYTVAIIVSVALALSFHLSSSEQFQASVLIGGFAIFGVASLVSTLRSRRRVLRDR
ncbi:MAG: hypothetical protein C0409_06145 [Novosphingobium sp.]|nr:hypothetical protein [Novosphingobium sp.]